MRIEGLSAVTAASLQETPLAFPGPVGWSAVAPPGFDRLEMTTLLRRQDFPQAADDLMNWRMHARAGLRVRASACPVELDSVVKLGLGRPPLVLWAPCRVIDVISTPDTRGFGYATLPGHPESGVEWFLLHRDDNGDIRFTIRAISAPVSPAARLAGPLTRRVQQWITNRYAHAMDGRT